MSLKNLIYENLRVLVFEHRQLISTIMHYHSNDVHLLQVMLTRTEMWM
jgi:hypothetical protein